MNVEQQIIELAQDLNNWVPMSEVPAHHPQFTYQSLKSMFWKKTERPGLERCSRRVGKRAYINVKLLGLYMAGELPEQKA